MSADGKQGRNDPVLRVRNLRTEYHTEREVVRAVDGVSFDVHAGETVAIVGESGAGKTVTARSILGLVDPPGRVLDGTSIELHGEELVGKTEREYRAVRGSGVTMVFQDSSTSLDPLYTIGNQLEETLARHRDLGGEAATERAAELLDAVAIPDARRRLGEYPHELSGGMRQRAAIALALACEPELLICDEPTTALDVTTQAGILELLADVQREHDLAMVFITHDMGVVAEVADRVKVMYAGEFVESAPVEDLFANPAHPYTRGLLAALPGRAEDDGDLHAMDGEVPTPSEPATACRFAPRCPRAFADCNGVHPGHVDVGEADGSHTAACLLYPADLPREQAVARHEEGGGRSRDSEHDGERGGGDGDTSRGDVDGDRSGDRNRDGNEPPGGRR